MKWLQICVEVDHELAEAIAELFSRYAPGKIALETTHIQEDDTTTGPLRVSAYIPVNDQLDSVKHSVEQGLWHLGQIQPLPSPTFCYIQEQDWAQSWKEHYRPLSVGKNFIIFPPWISISTSDRLPVILDPGMAFGTGTHPTTQLCLLAIENYLNQGQQVVDLGCGSGVLSIAAARLGASQVHAFDVDPEAVRVAEDNIHRNQLSDRVHVKQGSLEDLLKVTGKDFPLPDLLVANILASTLNSMIKQRLHQAIRKGGLAILSGILEEQLESLLANAMDQCFQEIQILEQEDWRAVILKVI